MRGIENSGQNFYSIRTERRIPRRGKLDRVMDFFQRNLTPEGYQTVEKLPIKDRYFLLEWWRRYLGKEGTRKAWAEINKLLSSEERVYFEYDF